MTKLSHAWNLTVLAAVAIVSAGIVYKGMPLLALVGLFAMIVHTAQIKKGA